MCLAATLSFYLEDHTVATAELFHQLASFFDIAVKIIIRRRQPAQPTAHAFRMIGSKIENAPDHSLQETSNFKLHGFISLCIRRTQMVMADILTKNTGG